jgi:hypothetical protein
MDLYSLTPHYFEWAVQHMADMAIRLAKEPRRELDVSRGAFLLGRQELGVPAGYDRPGLADMPTAPASRGKESVGGSLSPDFELTPEGRI